MKASGSGMVGIVGAGPVGLTLAARLASFGISSKIFDKAPYLQKKGSKACLIQGDSLEVLDKIGCSQSISNEGIGWRIARTYIKNIERMKQEFPERIGFSHFVNISQYRIEQELLNSIETNELVEMLWSHEVESYRENQNDIELSISTPSGKETHHCEYMVACDGVRSHIRDLSGVKYNGYVHKDLFLVTDIKANIPIKKERHFHFNPSFNPGRQLVMHPQPDNIWRIDWQLAPDADIEKEKMNGKLDKRIRDVIGDIPYNVEWISTYRFHQKVIENFKLGRLLFAGDAAHSFPPYGSRGMNSGIQDADNLAWKLSYVLNKHSSESLLESYHTERHGAALDNLKITEATIKFMVPPTRLKSLMRNSLLKMSVPFRGLRRKLDHGKMTEPNTYKQSGIIDSASNSPFTGKFADDAWVFLGDKKIRFRQLLGEEFVVLFLADEPVIERCLNGYHIKDKGMPVRILAAHPRGDDFNLKNGLVDTVSYDDIYFYETLKRAGDSAIVYRPDGYIASHQTITESFELTTLLDLVTGSLNSEESTNNEEACH